MIRIVLFIFFFCLFVQISFAGEGHRAGYSWAERNGIDDPDNCYSRDSGRWANNNINNSASFTEGCLEYLRDEEITNEDDEVITEDDEGEDEE